MTHTFDHGTCTGCDIADHDFDGRNRECLNIPNRDTDTLPTRTPITRDQLLAMVQQDHGLAWTSYWCTALGGFWTPPAMILRIDCVAGEEGQAYMLAPVNGFIYAAVGDEYATRYLLDADLVGIVMDLDSDGGTDG